MPSNLSIQSYLDQVVAGQPRKPSPIKNALQAIQDLFTSGLTDADIRAAAGIQTSKLELVSSGSPTAITLNNNVAIQFKNAANAAAGNIKQNTSDDLLITGASAGVQIDAANGIVGFGHSGATSKARAYDSAISKHIQMYHDATDGWLEVSSGVMVLKTFSANSDIVVLPQRDFRPSGNGVNKLGTATSQWNTYYGVNADVISSDRRVKSEIKDCEYGLEFVLGLKPRSYVKEGNPNREFGFIAQEVEELVSDKNTIISYDEKNDRYGLKYTEVIAPLVKAIQEQQAQIEDLKLKLHELVP